MTAETSDFVKAADNANATSTNSHSGFHIKIRTKLLVALLGIVGLMLILAFTGLSELRKANLRTAELLQDQVRLSNLKVFESSLQEIWLNGTAIFAETGGNTMLGDSAGFFKDKLHVIQSLGHLIETRDQPDLSLFSKDEIADVSRKTQEIKRIGLDIVERYEAGQIVAAKSMFELQLVPIIKSLDNLIEKRYLLLRDGMRSKALVNQNAFDQSWRMVLASAGIAVVIAILLGFLLSKSLIHTIEQIRVTLRKVAQGDFAARANIKTTDELGDLARSANRMTERLGTLYDELETANLHKSQFLANMSHELRTPMNSILGYTEMIRDGIYGPVPQKIDDPLHRVQVNGKILLSLINDVLDLSKIEAGALELALDTYSMSEILTDVVSTIEPIAASKGLEIRTKVEGGLPTGHGDAGRIRQVLLNIVGNAVKFTDKGYVEINLARRDQRFVVTVTDTGVGISAEQIDEVFLEFKQADASSTRAAGGTGLGLSISQKIVEMHGGRIEVASSLGNGSTFTVVLPVQATRS